MMPSSPYQRYFCVCAAIIAIPRAALSAAELPQPEREPGAQKFAALRQTGDAQRSSSADVFDRIWSLPSSYKNEESPFLNEFRFVGRFHLDQCNLDSALEHDSDWIVRRLRLGAKAEFFKRKLVAHVEVDIDPEYKGGAYRRLTSASLAWEFSKAVRVTMGKQSANFTLDGSLSSNELLTIDRSNVANNLWFPSEYIPGVSLSGKVGQWVYNTGYFSGGSDSPEFGGDEYDEAYAGVNYYLYGHKLKVQAGIAYTVMHDSAQNGGEYEGWSLTTALRVSW